MDAIEIGCKYAPDHCQRRQEAPKRILATPTAFVRFFRRTPVAWVALGFSEFVPPGALLLGCRKREDTREWLLNHCVFWHFPCL
jgi:hypothetical protein